MKKFFATMLALVCALSMVPCDVDGDDLLTISDVNLLLWELQQKQ